MVHDHQKLHWTWFFPYCSLSNNNSKYMFQDWTIFIKTRWCKIFCYFNNELTGSRLYIYQLIWPSWFNVMACHLVCAKLSPNYHLDPCEQTSIFAQYTNWHSRRCIENIVCKMAGIFIRSQCVTIFVPCNLSGHFPVDKTGNQHSLCYNGIFCVCFTSKPYTRSLQLVGLNEPFLTPITHTIYEFIIQLF